MSVGHLWADVQRYTLRQVSAFAAAASRFEKRRQAKAILASALGQGTSETVQEAVDELLT